uniref:Uncharacterized protein n=1 Tax=Arundo donax TaxID=35708 RepID=A0A0A9B291_ARUDO
MARGQGRGGGRTARRHPGSRRGTCRRRRHALHPGGSVLRFLRSPSGLRSWFLACTTGPTMATKSRRVSRGFWKRGRESNGGRAGATAAVTPRPFMERSGGLVAGGAGGM